MDKWYPCKHLTRCRIMCYTIIMIVKACLSLIGIVRMHFAGFVTWWWQTDKRSKRVCHWPERHGTAGPLDTGPGHRKDVTLPSQRKQGSGTVGETPTTRGVVSVMGAPLKKFARDNGLHHKGVHAAKRMKLCHLLVINQTQRHPKESGLWEALRKGLTWGRIQDCSFVVENS